MGEKAICPECGSQSVDVVKDSRPFHEGAKMACGKCTWRST